MMVQPPRALVLSPSATHPQDYGNRRRVWQITNFLKELGYKVDFLLYPFEPEWLDGIPKDAKDIQRAWDGFWVVPPSIPLHTRARGAYHEIDEWWDPALGTYLEWLFARRSYDVFVVNYAFLSRAFTYAPTATLRVLETHDVFSGRKEMLAALGAPLEFFYTTEDEEKIAFDRADVVVSIKDSEAKLIRTMTQKQVVSLPFFADLEKTKKRRRTGFNGLSVGFIGAQNSVNVLNMQAFLAEFDPMVRLYCPPLRFVIAGNVCRLIETDNPAFELIGRVDNVDDFYAQVDVTVAPMIYSTGIKVKVGEALGYGKGIVSTENGFDGFPPTDPMHSLPDIKAVGRALIELSFDDARRKLLVKKSVESATLAKRSTEAAFQTLAGVLRDRARRIVFITDRPYWREEGISAARLAQFAQLCTIMTRAFVFYLRTTKEPSHASGAPAEMFEFDLSKGAVDPRSLARQLIKVIIKQIGRSEVVISLRQPWAKTLYAEFLASGLPLIVDLWSLPLAEAVGITGATRHASLRFVDARGPEPSVVRSFETTVVRWPPNTLRDFDERPRSRRVVAVSREGDPDAAWIELEIGNAAAARGCTFDVFSVARGKDDVEGLSVALDTPDRPMLVVAICGSAALEQCMWTINGWGGVPLIALDRLTLPTAISDISGEGRLLHTCGELVDWIIQRIDYGLVAATQPNALDTGWSSVWKTLDGLLQRHSKAADDGPAAQRPETAEVISATKAA